MRAFHDKLEGDSDPRPHPWTGAKHDANAKFVDFRKHPELVRTALEDFLPFVQQPAIEKFFQLVEWMNGSKTIWETTECFFRPPGQQESKSFREYPLMCSGRLVFFCRDYHWQCRRSQWLFDTTLNQLKSKKLTPANACVGVFTFPTLFLGLSEDGGQTAPECIAIGVKWYGFGQNEDEAFGGFGVGVDAVSEVVTSLGEMIMLGEGIKP